MKGKGKWTSHIIAAAALAVFIILGLACASTPKSFEEMKELWLKPEWNKFKLELKFADKNVPQREQSFLYCLEFGVKDRFLSSYTKPGSVVVLPAEKNKKIWVRMESGSRKFECDLTLDLEAGQSYWVLDPYWEERNYGQGVCTVLPLNEEGIATYTRNMWGRSNGNLMPYGKKEDWASYEEYHQFVTQVWQIRKEETNKQLK